LLRAENDEKLSPRRGHLFSSSTSLAATAIGPFHALTFMRRQGNFPCFVVPDRANRAKAGVWAFFSRLGTAAAGAGRQRDWLDRQH